MPPPLARPTAPPVPPSMSSAEAAPPIDASLRFVRVRQRRPNGLIEFDFSIGEPSLFVEMILPAGAFDDFCSMHRAQVLPEEEEAAAEAPAEDDWDWRLADATHTRFKSAPPGP